MLIIIGNNIIETAAIITAGFGTTEEGDNAAKVYLRDKVEIILVGEDADKLAFYLRHTPGVINVNVAWEDRDSLDAALIAAREEQKAKVRKPVVNHAGLYPVPSAPAPQPDFVPPTEAAVRPNAFQAKPRNPSGTGLPPSPPAPRTPVGPNPLAADIDFDQEPSLGDFFPPAGGR
jgi:hypothetical protein